jgi:hypothetical protein
MYFENVIDKKDRRNSIPKNGKIFNVKKIKMDKTKLIEARDVTGFESELLVH